MLSFAKFAICVKFSWYKWIVTSKVDISSKNEWISFDRFSFSFTKK